MYTVVFALQPKAAGICCECDACTAVAVGADHAWSVTVEETGRLQDYSVHVISAIEHSACPLTWWVANEATYPNVARLACKLLAMPATSATSECLFSKARNVITKKM